MKDVKFRGMSKDKVWHYGSLVKLGNGILMIHEIKEDSHQNKRGKFVEVIADTVGQYTKVKDINGTEIYEDDIVRYHDLMEGEEKSGVVIFINGSYCIGGYLLGRKSVEIISSMHGWRMNDAK